MVVLGVFWQLVVFTKLFSCCEVSGAVGLLWVRSMLAFAGAHVHRLVVILLISYKLCLCVWCSVCHFNLYSHVHYVSTVITILLLIWLTLQSLFLSSTIIFSPKGNTTSYCFSII